MGAKSSGTGTTRCDSSLRRLSADRGAVEHILHGHVIDRPLLDQRNQSAAKALTRTPDAPIRLAMLLFPLPGMFLQFGALIFGPLIFGPLILGHGPPLCSATPDGPRLDGVSPLHCE